MYTDNRDLICVVVLFLKVILREDVKYVLNMRMPVLRFPIGMLVLR